MHTFWRFNKIDIFQVEFSICSSNTSVIYTPTYLKVTVKFKQYKNINRHGIISNNLTHNITVVFFGRFSDLVIVKRHLLGNFYVGVVLSRKYF